MNSMPILIEKTAISDLYIITNHIFKDERGCIIKYFEKELYKENGLPTEFYESIEMISKKGVLRGLHFQTNPSQGRLIHVVAGTIFNVAIDLRTGSDTFGKYECIYLDRDKSIFIPEDFANGYLTIEENTIVTCQFTNRCVAENSIGIIWNDSGLNIPWPLENLDGQLTISEKDKVLQSFNQYRESVPTSVYIKA